MQSTIEVRRYAIMLSTVSYRKNCTTLASGAVQCRTKRVLGKIQLLCRDLLSSHTDYSVLQAGPRMRELNFVAVVLLMDSDSYGGYFPDLSGSI